MSKLYSLINGIKIHISSQYTNPSAYLKQNDGKLQLSGGDDFHISHRTSNSYHRRHNTDIPPSKSSIEFAPSYELEVQFMLSIFF